MAENSRTSPSSINIWTRLYVQINSASSALTFNFLDGFPSCVYRHFNAAAYTLRCHLYYFMIRVQFINSFNQSIVFIIPLLTTFLQLKYQGINDQIKTPFATHPRTMLVAVSCSVLYYLAYIAVLRLPPRRRFAAAVAYHCMVWSGYASVASLASLLFPDWISPFVHAMFVLLSAVELLYSLNQEVGAEFQEYKRRVRRFLNTVCRVAASSFGPPQQLLPI